MIQEMMKRNKIYKFGGKSPNIMNNYLTKVDEHKFKIKIGIEGISKWNIGY